MTPSSRTRVLFINRSYWPDVEATGQLLTELCEDLASRYDVHVLCGQPVENRDGETFRRRGTQVQHGVTIHRIAHTRFPKGSSLGRICNMVTFLLSATWQALRVPRPDVVITETDPPLLCLLGRLLQVIRRTRFVCYLQDIYPDVAVALGKLKPGWLTQSIRRIFFGIYRRADAVVVLSRDMQRLLADDGIAEQRLHRIPNWMDSSTVVPIMRRDNQFLHQSHATERGWGSQVALSEKFIVMYSGNMGLTQRLEDLLNAAAVLLTELPDVQLVLVGNGASRPPLEQLAAERQLTNVSFFDYVPKQMLAHSLNAADLHVILLDPRITQYLMPSKLYGVLAAAKPMIVMAPSNCELSELCVRERLGWVVTPGDTRQFVDAIRQAWQESDMCDDEPCVAPGDVPNAATSTPTDAVVAQRTASTTKLARTGFSPQGHRGRELLLREYDRPIATQRFARLLESLGR